MPSQVLSQLEQLREDVAAQLRLVPALAGFAVVTRAKGDIVQTIENELARVGLSIEVYIGSARITTDSSSVVVLNPAVIGVVAYEEVLINQDPVTGTGKGALYVIEQVLVALKMTRPSHAAGVLMPDPKGPQQGNLPKSPTSFVVTQEFTTIVQISHP